MKKEITITPVRVADLLAEGERMPVYVHVDGELELFPGLRLVPAPGHTRGSQMVVVETGRRPVVVGGDVAVWFGELDEPHTAGQLRVRALDPELVWLSHEHQPWRPPHRYGITPTISEPSGFRPAFSSSSIR